ncbi:DUF5916 domain-containing protein [Tenacibaculum amylolyticum]|uniref:DUF5916 domain-containing protein n=1 Tax=Tenacibaculum amylolyticum TaxID=104269 RepID=UPI003894ABC9
MKAKPILFFATFLCTIQIISQQSQSIPKKKYYTKFITSVPEIDGAITDSAWDELEWGTDFTEKDPDEGTPPTYQTKFKIGYDNKYLYVALRAFDDEPEKIEERLTRRDGFAGDRINVIIDSYHDKRTAFVFTITAAGVKGEELATNNGQNWDASWNPIWYTNAVVDDKGWTAEMKIPFTQLRFGNAEEQVWGLNINRTFFRRQERSLWQRIPNEVSGFISEAGELHGLKGLKSQKQLEIQPFTVLQYDTYEKEAGNPFRTGSDFSFNGGLDAKIGITNDLTLDLTVNPDFGQVEADPGNIVLDGFDDVFFQEQRPFFVENKNIFDFRVGGQDNVFYSRRIGRSPQGSVELNDGEFVDVPVNTTILSAAKFSGKTQDGWSIGILESVTNNEYAEIDSNGDRREVLVEPLTNYLVGRVQKDFNERNSYIGGVFTSVVRDKSSLDYLHKAAYTGGVDFRHEWHNRDYFIQGNFALSHVLGSKEAITRTQESIRHLFQRVDASHLEVDPNKTSLTGTGGRIFGGKRGGGNWRFFLGATWKSPEFELNDIGFLRSTDQIWQFSNVEYLWQEPTNVYRRMASRIIFRSAYDFAGHLNRVETQWNTFVNWENNWGTELRFGHNPRVISNTYLRGGPRWRNANESFYNLSFGSDSSKKFSFSAGFRNSFGSQDTFSVKNYDIRFNYQPLDALSLSLSTNYTDNRNKVQYVTVRDFGNERRYVLGEINNNNWSTTLRLNYSINPNLSIQYYGQPFIARGRYKNFNYVTGNPIATDLNNRVTFYDESTNQIQFGANSSGTDVFLVDEDLDGTTDYEFSNPDFSFVQLRTNLVVRWEYIPGSELFLVWSQGTTGSVDSDRSLLGGLNNQILENKLDNTFLIKATYRFL